MAIDLEKLAIIELIKNPEDIEFFHSLNESYFTAIYLIIYNSIGNFYTNNGRLPSLAELIIKCEEASVIKEWLTQYEDIIVDQSLIKEELENQAARNKYLDCTLDVLDSISQLSAEMIAEHLSEIQLQISDIETESKDNIADAIESDYEDDILEVYTSGFSSKFDEEVGGFASQELIIIGGERGSGKSIITQNLCNYHYEVHKNSVAYFNIEMTKSNVRKRFLSMISGVPYASIWRGTLTDIEKRSIEMAKVRYFYEETDIRATALANFFEHKDKDLLKQDLKFAPKNKHKYFFIDDASLTMTKLDYIVTRLKKQYNLGLIVVDYINIIKDNISSKEQDWLVQQKKAEHLKEIAKKHDIILVSPYQIHTDGSAKRAKSIEDSADRSFKFFTQINKETGLKDSLIRVYQSKARDNEEFPFTIGMNWQTLTIEEPPMDTGFEGEAPRGLRAA